MEVWLVSAQAGAGPALGDTDRAALSAVGGFAVCPMYSHILEYSHAGSRHISQMAERNLHTLSDLDTDQTECRVQRPRLLLLRTQSAQAATRVV